MCIIFGKFCLVPWLVVELWLEGDSITLSMISPYDQDCFYRFTFGLTRHPIKPTWQKLELPFWLATSIAEASCHTPVPATSLHTVPIPTLYPLGPWIGIPYPGRYSWLWITSSWTCPPHQWGSGKWPLTSNLISSTGGQEPLCFCWFLQRNPLQTNRCGERCQKTTLLGVTIL